MDGVLNCDSYVVVAVRSTHQIWGQSGAQERTLAPVIAWNAMLERSKGRVQTKRDTLARQVGGWASG
jgi:hypothetical protein